MCKQFYTRRRLGCRGTAALKPTRVSRSSHPRLRVTAPALRNATGADTHTDYIRGTLRFGDQLPSPQSAPIIAPTILVVTLEGTEGDQAQTPARVAALVRPRPELPVVAGGALVGRYTRLGWAHGL